MAALLMALAAVIAPTIFTDNGVIICKDKETVNIEEEIKQKNDEIKNMQKELELLKQHLKKKNQNSK